MQIPGTMHRLSVAAALSALLLAPTAAMTQDDPGERAIEARQGFMQVVTWEAGPLFGMAKGEIAYDADTAADNAEKLNTVVQYPVERLFIPDTSKADYAGDTRALAAIWENPDEFAASYEAFQEAVAVVAEEAGKGRDAMAASVQELGKSCGNCHDDFRAEEF